MSTDPSLLATFSSKSEVGPVRYFEEVQAQLELPRPALDYGILGGSCRFMAQKSLFVCVTLRELLLVRRNMSGVIKGGRLEYQWIETVVEDTQTPTLLEITMNDSCPGDRPRRIVLSSEHRTELVRRISICYLMEAMTRLGKVVGFPKSQAALGEHVGAQQCVKPFNDCRAETLMGYSFFVKVSMECSKDHVGVDEAQFIAPASLLPGLKADAGLIELSVHVYEPVGIQDLVRVGREHIRWLAMEYKRGIAKTPRTFVIRNQAYLKKMNLANDLASWTCWELLLKEDNQTTTAIVLLRRQHLPPLMDMVQDLVVIAKCPSTFLEASGVMDEHVLHEARFVADTLSPQAPHPSLYTGLVQAKLDALLYDEDAYGWLRSRLRMEPSAIILKYAWVFVKGILQILRDDNVDNVLSNPGLVDDALRRIAKLESEGSSDVPVEDQDPMSVVWNLLKCVPEMNSELAREATHAWHARVARYLTFCLDGGFLGSRLTLAIIAKHLTVHSSSEVHLRLAPVIDFLAHLRPKSLCVAWAPRGLPTQINMLGLLNTASAGCDEVLFTNRVMQVLVETGYLMKVLQDSSSGSGGGGSSSGGGEHAMTSNYTRLLSRVLRSPEASTGLRASICRQVIEISDMEVGNQVGLALLEAMQTGNLFLATYACAALVNVSQANSDVGAFLIGSGAIGICLQQLRTFDDDLMIYTLILLVHLTKELHHRDAFKQAGLMPMLVDILGHTHKLWMHKRQARLVTELCSVMGQMCNDAGTRRTMNEESQVVHWLLYIFRSADGVGDDSAGPPKARGPLSASASKTISKVLFALKQLAADTPTTKEEVGSAVIHHLVLDLSIKENLEHRDWASNAIMLLLLLVASEENVRRVAVGWAPTYKILVSSPLFSSEITKDRLATLERRVSSFAARSEHAARSQPHSPGGPSAAGSDA